MPLEIVTIEHSAHPEVLTTPAQILTFPLSADEIALIEQMKDLLLRLKGVGLAAPQVGVAKQIIIINIAEEAKVLRKDANEIVPVTVLINPSYTQAPDATITQDWEGCFSVVDTTGKVPRFNKITYRAFTPYGAPITATAEGFTARVLQHEIDHLQGVLITKRLTSECLQGHPNEMLKIRYSELSPAQKEIVKKIIHEREKVTDHNDKAQVQALVNMKKFINDDK